MQGDDPNFGMLIEAHAGGLSDLVGPKRAQ
jgi:hypothetical protein